MSSPLDSLRKEHKKVLKLLDNLEKDLVNPEKAVKEVSLLEKEFDKHSLNKEEKVLFPEIEKFMPREGPTGVMMMEHKDLVESINDFKKSRDKETGVHIIELLRQHIDKEDNILFMMAEMHLDNNQKKSILEKFKKIDLKYK